MAFLEIGKSKHEAKASFKMEKTADKEYNSTDKEGNEVGGFHTLYTGLLSYDNKALVAFWDSALSTLTGKARPTVEGIEKALEERIETDGDTDALFKEAFAVMDESGFFKRTVANFWADLDMFVEMPNENEAEKEQALAYVDRMKKAREELKA